MCTGITYQTKDFYFGRTLDYEFSYGEEITITPRCFPLHFRHEKALNHHFAMIGMAHVAEGFPLYYDAVNEHGLAIAGLNFIGNAVYGPKLYGKQNIAVFEFIPWVLGQCRNVEEAKKLLGNLNLTDTPFSTSLPTAQLHWLLADSEEAVTVEATADGLHVYHNPIGVLTNNPPFPQQLEHLSHFLHLSAKEPENRFSPALNLMPSSRGMGALGLPGDLSSQSRFVRAAFTKLNSVSGSTEPESVSQFFHILSSVSQTRGCCELPGKQYEITIYSACCNATKGIYYYTTYENRQISAVDMHCEDLNATHLIRFPLQVSSQIHRQN